MHQEFCSIFTLMCLGYLNCEVSKHLMEISTSHCQTVEPLYTNSNTTTYSSLSEAMLQSCWPLAAILFQLLTGLYLYSCIKCNKSTSTEGIQTMDSQGNVIQLLLVGAL